MALNPPLLPPSHHPSGKQCFPVPLANELFVLNRRGIELEATIAGFEGSPSVKFSATGDLYLSTYRITFVAKKPTPQFSAFDLPLGMMRGEKFEQPIFGCNHLKGEIAPLPPMIKSATGFKLYFKEGGAGTFLSLFLELVHRHRVSQQNSRPEPALHNVNAMVQMTQQAYVDPNDPSVIYVQQPSVPVAVPVEQATAPYHPYNPPQPPPYDPPCDEKAKAGPSGSKGV